MAKSTDQFEAEMRLLAIEYMVSDIYRRFYQLLNVPLDAVKKTNAEAVSNLSLSPIPGLEPVEADLAADEFASAVRRLLTQIEQQMELASKPKA